MRTHTLLAALLAITPLAACSDDQAEFDATDDPTALEVVHRYSMGETIGLHMNCWSAPVKVDTEPDRSGHWEEQTYTVVFRDADSQTELASHTVTEAEAPNIFDDRPHTFVVAVPTFDAPAPTRVRIDGDCNLGTDPESVFILVEP